MNDSVAPRVWPVLLALSVAASSGCSLAFDPNRTHCDDDLGCASDVTGVEGLECREGACVVREPWSCLDSSPMALPEEAMMRALLKDEDTDEPLVGATLRTCERRDVTCARPNLTLVTDENGTVEFELEPASTLIEVTADGYPNTLLMGVDMFDRETGPTFEVEYGLHSTAVFAELESLAGVVQEGALGYAILGVKDCGFEDAPGVRLDLDTPGPAAAQRYLVADVPSASATETDLESASAVVFNVSPGSLTATATLVDGGRLIGRPTSIVVREGWQSVVTLVPEGVRVDVQR